MLGRIGQLASHLRSSTTTSPTIANTRKLALGVNPNTAASVQMSEGQHPITLYTAQTPNGVKISIALEELGIPYNVHKISMMANEQKEPWFLKINPNGRIPAITDKNGPKGEINVFESGAILLYLVEYYDKEHKLSFPRGTPEYWDMVQLVFFQNAGLGPMQGQANHFYRYAPEKIEYGITRYTNEAKRLYRVLEKRLEEQSAKNSEWLAGDHYSIADITTVGWANSAGWAGIDITEFPRVHKWRETVLARPLTRKGLDVPEPNKMRELEANPEEAEKRAKEASKWIMSENK